MKTINTGGKFYDLISCQGMIILNENQLFCRSSTVSISIRVRIVFICYQQVNGNKINGLDFKTILAFRYENMQMTLIMNWCLV